MACSDEPESFMTCTEGSREGPSSAFLDGRGMFLMILWTAAGMEPGSWGRGGGGRREGEEAENVGTLLGVHGGKLSIADPKGKIRQCLAPSSASMCVSDWLETRVVSLW